MSVQNLNVSPSGEALTADVVIAVSASVGSHVVVVVTPFGNSTGADTGSNAFAVTAP